MDVLGITLNPLSPHVIITKFLSVIPMLNHSGTYENQVYDHQGLLLLILNKFPPPFLKERYGTRKENLYFNING